MNILLVDDDKNIRDILKFLLKDLHINIWDCGSMGEAIDLLNKGVRFHLIVSDYDMPNGNGLELYKSLQEIDTQAKFLLLTGTLGLYPPADSKTFLGVVNKCNLVDMELIVKRILSNP